MSDFIHDDDLVCFILLILLRLSMATIANVQLVCRHWRWVVRSEAFGRFLYDQERARPIPHHPPQTILGAILLINSSRISVNYTTNLLRVNGNGVSGRFYVRDFPFIRFPVTMIIGTCDGLVCLLDSLKQLFVINPRTLSYCQFRENRRPRCYAFGRTVSGNTRCYLILKVRDEGFSSVTIYNLTNNKSKDLKYAWEGCNCRVDEGASSSFANGRFYWLGRVTSALGNAIASVIIFDPSQETFSYKVLPLEMRDLRLRIGNVGEDITAVWETEPRQLSYFWVLDHNSNEFTPVIINTYTSGINFQPLCCVNDQYIMLRNHSALDRYHIHEHVCIQLNFDRERMNYFRAPYMGIAFTPTFISTGDLQMVEIPDTEIRPPELEDGAHAERSAYNDRHRLNVRNDKLSQPEHGKRRHKKRERDRDCAPSNSRGSGGKKPI